jgi:hypothetical protein
MRGDGADETCTCIRQRSILISGLRPKVRKGRFAVTFPKSDGRLLTALGHEATVGESVAIDGRRPASLSQPTFHNSRLLADIHGGR